MRLALCVICLVSTVAVAAPVPDDHYMCPTAVSAQRRADAVRFADDDGSPWGEWIAFAGLGLAGLASRRAIRL